MIDLKLRNSLSQSWALTALVAMETDQQTAESKQEVTLSTGIVNKTQRLIQSHNVLCHNHTTLTSHQQKRGKNQAASAFT